MMALLLFIKLIASSFIGNNRKLGLFRVARLEIPLPPITEQKRIVKKLDALSTETKKLEKIYEQKLADLEELKKSVLKSAFAGKL